MRFLTGRHIWLMEDDQPEDFDEDEDGAGDASDGKETKTGEPALQ